MQSLPHRNPALQQESADLIDDAGALTDQSLAHPMERLQVELVGGLGRNEFHGRTLHRLGDPKCCRRRNDAMGQSMMAALQTKVGYIDARPLTARLSTATHGRTIHWVNIVGLTMAQFLHHVTKPLPAQLIRRREPPSCAQA